MNLLDSRAAEKVARLFLFRSCSVLLGPGVLEVPRVSQRSLANRKEIFVKAKTVEELLVHLDLSQEERERHAELIQECLEREKKLLLFQGQSEEGLKILGGCLQTIGTTLEEVHRSLQRINDRLGEVYLRRMPASKLSKA